MKKTLLLFISLLFFHLSYAQNILIEEYEDQIKKEKNDSLQMHLLAKLAFEYWDSNPEKGRELAKESLDLNKEYGINSVISVNLNTIGVTYWVQGNYDKALEYFLEAVAICEKDQHYIGMGATYTNIGNIYQESEQYLEAIDYQKKAVEANTKANNTEGIITAISNIGLNYVFLKKYDKALAELAKAEKLLLDSENSHSTVAIHVYEYTGQTYDESGNYDEALLYYHKALELGKKLQGVKSMSSNLIHVAEIYLKIKEYSKVDSLLTEAIQKASKHKLSRVLLDAYLIKSEFFERTKNKENALAYFKKYDALKDSIFDTEKSKQITEMQVKYEADKKEQENLLYKAESKRQLSISVTIGITLTLLMILTAILFRNYSLKRKTNQILENQKEELQKKNNKIVASINYAERIQKAALSDVEEIKNLPEHFILFQPKDIVSGDFYWFFQKENKVVICAADCTGHGVPGAFMSMLGISFLNRIVSEKNILEPHLILNELQTQVENTLNQDKTQNRDGMDVALCVLDLEKNILEFAGAKNPLICINNKEVIRIKGDSLSIGGRKPKHTEGFTKKVIEIDEETHFYIFSDGFQDQFGGEKKRKFMTKPFHKLLKEVHEESPEIQKDKLASTLEDWMSVGKQKQVDDILVIGFKVKPK